MKACNELKTSLDVLTSVDEKAFYLYEFWLANRGNHLELIKEKLKEIKKESLEFDSTYALGWCNYILGWMANDLGNFNESFFYLKKARENFEKCGDKWALSNTLNGLAGIYSQLGAHDKALEHYLFGLELAEEIQDIELISNVAFNIGAVFADLKQYSEALYYYEELIVEYSSVPNEKSIMLSTIGKTYKSLGRYEEALEKFKEALQLAQDAIGAVFAHQELASTYKLQDRKDLAYKHYEKCLELARKIKTLPFIASALMNLGLLEKEKGKMDSAQKYLEEALALSEQTTSKRLRAMIVESLAPLYREIGRAEEAYDYLEEVSEYKEKAFSEELIGNIGILKIKQARQENLIYRDLYDRINTISSIGRTITASLNIEEVGLKVYEQLNELLPADNLILGTVDKQSQGIVYKLVIKAGQKIKNLKNDLGTRKFIERKCLQEKKGLTLNQLSDEDRAFACNLITGEILSLLCCPLLLREESLGFIMVQSKEKDAYSDYHLDILNALASYIVIALENGELFFNAQELASKDALTGLCNRRAIFKEAKKAFSTSKRYASPLTVIVADLDKFKNINDNYGHDVGDLVLKTTAKIFSENIRNVDFIGRIGGEEFLFVLPQINAKGAKILASRLCDFLMNYQYEIGMEKFSVTASFGLAQVQEDDENVEETIKRADLAQYEAKRLGRARVEVCSKGK